MKNLKILFIAFSFISVLACTSSDDTTETIIAADIKCGFHNGNQLWKGPEGGCYYYNSNDNKTYVDRSECDC
jgi:hypothetical protein